MKANNWRFILSFVLLWILSACTGQGNMAAPAPSDQHSRTQGLLTGDVEHNGMINRGDHALDFSNRHESRRNPSDFGVTDVHALRIADLAEDEPGVSDATAIVTDKIILIGIDSWNNTTDSRHMEQIVRRKVQAREPGYRVYVTGNKQLHTRIRSLTEGHANPYHPSRTAPLNHQQIELEMQDIVRQLS